MTSYQLPGLYTNRDVQNLKEKLSGKTYMNFIVEAGGIAGNNNVIISTTGKHTKKALSEMVIHVLVTGY